MTMNSMAFHQKQKRHFIEYFFILIVFSSSIFFSGLDSYQLQGSGENRVAGIAAQMAISGDLVVPRLNIEPFLEKPPLYFWIGSACFNLFGINDFAARLPSATAAVLCVFLVFFIACKAGFSNFTAFISALALATTTGFFSLGHNCATDMVLCLFITSSMVCFYQYSSSMQDVTKWYWYVCFIISLSCSLLTKGLVGLAIPLSGLFAWLLLRPQFIFKEWVLLLTGIVISLIPISVWLYFLHNALGWNAVYEIVWSNNFGRFINAYGGHHEPFYFYIKSFPKHFTPWVIFLPFALAYHFVETKEPKKKKSPIFFLLWFIAPFILLSFSSGKRGIYLLSLYPAAALLVGSAIGDILENSDALKNIFFIPSIILIIALAFLSMGAGILFIYYKHSFLSSIVICLPGTLLTILSCQAFCKKKFKMLFKLLVTTISLVLFIYNIWLSPFINKDYSYKSVFEYCKKLDAKGVHVKLFKPLERIRGASFYYLKKDLPVISDKKNMGYFIDADHNNVALVTLGQKEHIKIPSTILLKTFIVGRIKFVFLANQNINVKTIFNHGGMEYQ